MLPFVFLMLYLDICRGHHRLTNNDIHIYIYIYIYEPTLGLGFGYILAWRRTALSLYIYITIYIYIYIYTQRQRCSAILSSEILAEISIHRVNTFEIDTEKRWLFWPGLNILIHWSRVTHSCLSLLYYLCSDNSLSLVQCQVIIQTNGPSSLIGPLWIDFSENYWENSYFHSRECTWKCRLQNSWSFYLNISTKHQWNTDGE